MSDHHTMTFKFRWMTPLLGLLTLAGIVFSLYKKPYKWDEAANKVEELAIKSAAHDVALAVIVSQLTDISNDVKEIKRAVK